MIGHGCIDSSSPKLGEGVKAAGCSKYWRVFIDFRYGNQEEN